MDLIDTKLISCPSTLDTRATRACLLSLVARAPCTALNQMGKRCAKNSRKKNLVSVTSEEDDGVHRETNPKSASLKNPCKTSVSQRHAGVPHAQKEPRRKAASEREGQGQVIVAAETTSGITGVEEEARGGTNSSTGPIGGWGGGGRGGGGHGQGRRKG